LHPVIPGSAARAELGEIPAHDRGGAPKGERPAYLLGRGRACPPRRGNRGAPFGAPPPSLGSKDIASHPFEASFLEADPDANRIAGTQFRVVIAGLAVVTRGYVAV
jgi:hypothetical protein